MWTPPSYTASLVRADDVRRIVSALDQRINRGFASHKGGETGRAVTRAVHRYQETIAGQPYQIEVVPVSQERWRAYIVRIPGVPTALMPFYGATPADAADQLRRWLARAHQLAADAQ